MRKLTLICTLVILITGLIGFIPPTVDAGNVKTNVKQTSQSVISTVENFINAQKNCDVESMIKYSKYFPEINYVNDLYQKICKDQTLTDASVTNLTIINNDLALVSMETKYKNRIFINTTPVFKENEQWKLVKGISGTDITQNSKEPFSKNDAMVYVKTTIDQYSKAIKSGKINEMKKFRKDLSIKDNKTLETHLEHLSNSILKINVLETSMLSDTLAVVTLEHKFERTDWRSSQVVYNDNGNWKIVFGYDLVHEAIPIGDTQVDL